MNRLPAHRCNRPRPFLLAGAFALGLAAGMVLAAADPPAESPQARPPANDAEVIFWLQNMVWHHHYSMDEMVAATGLAPAVINAALSKFDIVPEKKPKRPPAAPLLILPYPGGRHPRIGFLEGAIRPQRETKISIFTPWDEASYVVVDVPEAIFSNLGLLYLAHTHVPTIFDQPGRKLDVLEWNRRTNGTLDIGRRLPNDVGFGARITPAVNAVHMELWLTNGTKAVLTGLRVQTCVMLKGAAGFTAQTNANKVFSKPYVACQSEDGRRWVITAWEPCDRTWGNAPVPCLHSDPRFPDCPPGETRAVRGWLSFYEGSNIAAEFQRIEKTNWRKGGL